MFLSPTVTHNRNLAVEEFYSLRMDALRESFLDNILGRNNCLVSFPDKIKPNISNRKFLGVKDIPVEKIIGTLGRNCDFDTKFRPINKHLRDRWVNVFVSLDAEDWPPILVHKIGDVYYVEDGHHRTSIARSTGRAFISAEVWEYSTNSFKENNCQPEPSYSSSCCSAGACLA
jgi:hypothetical protein